MRYPVGSNPYIECAICGRAVPLSMAQRHYKKKFWVDARCADDISADDLRARVLPREDDTRSPQPVTGQGPDGASSGFGVEPFGVTPFGSPR